MERGELDRHSGADRAAAKRPYIAVKLEPTEATLETIRETLKIMSEAKEHYGKTE